jgi:muconolactone D-isomerase
MLFMVQMDVHIPPHLSSDMFNKLKVTEKEKSQELQRSGKWRHLWRVAGKYSNVSIFDVADSAELHDIMTSLPLFPYMTVAVTALCRHPSAIEQDA